MVYLVLEGLYISIVVWNSSIPAAFLSGGLRTPLCTPLKRQVTKINSRRDDLDPGIIEEIWGGREKHYDYPLYNHNKPYSLILKLFKRFLNKRLR
jgi:hypothetical protein